MINRAKEEIIISDQYVIYPLQEVKVTIDDDVIKDITVILSNSQNPLMGFLEGKAGEPYRYYFDDRQDFEVIVKVLLGLMSTRKAYNGFKEGEFGNMRCGTDSSSYPSIKLLLALGLSKDPVKYVKGEFYQEIRNHLNKMPTLKATNNELFEQQPIVIGSALATLVGGSQAFFTHCPANPEIVKLKNGTDAHKMTVTAAMMNLQDLQTDATAFIDFVKKCRDPSHIMKTTKATELGLIDQYGVHEITRNIVLSAVQGEGFDMTLESPIAENRPAFKL